jgi:2-methylcitrate dehydratase PrpD
MYAQGLKRASLLDDLGSRFAGRDISFKAWPSCRDTHIYVQAALQILAEHNLDIADIAAVTANVTAKNMIVCEPVDLKRRPQTAIAGKFSLYYTVATTLVERRLDFASYSEEALKRENVLALADKVAFRTVPAMGDGPVLEIKLRNGTVHRSSVRSVYGSPAAPLSDEELVKKFVDCGSQALRPRAAAELGKIATQLLAIEKAQTLRPLLRRI